MKLPDAPASPVAEDGNARFGTYRGACEDISLDGFGQDQPRLTRLLREKSWQWFGLSNKRVALGGALVNAGLATSVFMWVYDRRAQKMLADASTLLPPGLVQLSHAPARGRTASSMAPGRRLSIERDGDQLRIEGSISEIGLDVTFDAPLARAITAICPVGADGDGINVTQKECCLPVRGQLSVSGRSFELGEDAIGMLDYSHGLLERETSWRWAIAAGRVDDGTRVGFNVVSDFNEGLENVAWVGDKIYKVGQAEFDFNPKRPRDMWRVTTSDGLLDVTLDVEGVRQNDIDLAIAASQYTQPLGRWHGKVDGRLVHGIFGVAEVHRAKW